MTNDDVGRRSCEHLRSAMLETEGGSKLIRQCSGCHFFLSGCEECEQFERWTEHPERYCSTTCEDRARRHRPKKAKPESLPMFAPAFFERKARRG